MGEWGGHEILPIRGEKDRCTKQTPCWRNIHYLERKDSWLCWNKLCNLAMNTVRNKRQRAKHVERQYQPAISYWISLPSKTFSDLRSRNAPDSVICTFSLWLENSRSLSSGAGGDAATFLAQSIGTCFTLCEEEPAFLEPICSGHARTDKTSKPSGDGSVRWGHPPS